MHHAARFSNMVSAVKCYSLFNVRVPVHLTFLPKFGFTSRYHSNLTFTYYINYTGKRNRVRLHYWDRNKCVNFKQCNRRHGLYLHS